MLFPALTLALIGALNIGRAPPFTAGVQPRMTGSDSGADGDVDMTILQRRMDEVRESQVSSMMQTAANWRAGRCSQSTILAIDDWIRRLRACAGQLVCGTFLGDVVLVDIESGSLIKRWEYSLSAQATERSIQDDSDSIAIGEGDPRLQEVTALDFDGEVWAAGDAGGHIRVHSMSHDNFAVASCASSISALCLYKERLYSTSLDKRLVCWDITDVLDANPDLSTNTTRTMSEACSLVVSHSIISMSACMGYAALGLANGEILLCTLSPLRILLRFDAAEAAVSSIHLVTTSQLLCGTADGNVIMWRLDESEESGRRKTVFKGHKAAVVSVVGDTEKIVSGARDGTVRVWDIERGALRFMLQGFTAYIGSIEISSSWLIADGTNNVIVKVDFAEAD